MKIVLSCSDKKNGDFFRWNNVDINFVSDPNHNFNNNQNYFHPDDIIPNEDISWRDLISQQNPQLNLLPAYNLYANPIYGQLFQAFENDFFIFSAGWGIIRADYLIPKYDITFSEINNFTSRKEHDIFDDFFHLQNINANEEILVLLPKRYIHQFCRLTNHLANMKIVYYFGNPPNVDFDFLNDTFEFRALPFFTTNNRKWHYEFAQRLLNNEIEI